jgi:hypothetical protein
MAFQTIYHRGYNCIQLIWSEKLPSYLSEFIARAKVLLPAIAAANPRFLSNA